MKKYYHTYLRICAISTCLVFALSANAQNVPTNLNQKRAEAVTSTSSVVPQPLKIKNNASVQREIEVLYEDFDLIPEGNTVATGNIGDRYVDLLASHSMAPGRYVNTEYTPNSGTWEGDWVYAGKNGSVVLQCYNPSFPARLRTPLGDYSGDLTVTVRCRPLPSFFGADNEVGYATTFGMIMYCRANIGGYDSSELATTDISGTEISSGMFYLNDGWTEITYTLRNESANADGYIELSTSFAAEIDWVKITDSGTFLAAPVVKEATDFTEDGFTISWDKVRRSYDYYIDLWKINYTGEVGIDDNIDFEAGTLPDGWKAEGSQVEDYMGIDGTKGLHIGGNGAEAALETPIYDEAIGTLSFSAMFVINDYTALNGYGLYGMLYVDGLTDDGWVPVSQAYCDGQLTMGGMYYEYALEGDQFDGRYKSIRIYAEGFGEANYMVIDNVNVWGPRPYELTRVIDNVNGAIRDTDNDDYAYNRYHFTNTWDPCSFTFTGLAPEGEYFYRVRSHDVDKFSGTVKHRAFGVASPQLLPPTNIESNSYTANWQDVTKAQSYLVRNYKTETVTNDESMKCLFNEHFSKYDGAEDFFTMVPVGNTKETNLNDYTDMPGWTGRNNMVGSGVIGGDWYAGSYLTTPTLSINPERGTYTVYIEAYGYQGDQLYIEFLESGVYATIPFSSDFISGSFEGPEAVAGERIRFTSYYDLPFGMGAVEIYQDVQKGDVIHTLMSEQEVPAGVGCLDITGLSEEDMYAYQVISRFELEKKVVFSKSNEMMPVTMPNFVASNATPISEVDHAAYEVSRFNANGIQVGKHHKGFNIIKMSDGSLRKVIIK